MVSLLCGNNWKPSNKKDSIGTKKLILSDSEAKKVRHIVLYSSEHLYSSEMKIARQRCGAFQKLENVGAEYITYYSTFIVTKKN